MEKLIQHIESLIRRHDYVIVPDLGGFVFQKQSSVILADMLTPPKTVISFNPLMKISDGLLAIEISRAEKMSFREAMQLINTQVASIKSVLDGGKAVDFGNLGQLMLGDDKKLIFKPSENDNFIPSNFGLSTLHYAPKVLQTEENERREIRILLPSKGKMARYAAIAVVAAGIFFATPRISENYQNLGNINPFSKIKQSEEVAEVIAETPAVQPIEIVEEAVIPAVELKHHVIVSCMNTQEEADKYCDWLKAQNYTKSHILSPIKTYRISIQSFETKKEAVDFMTYLRNTKSQFADAWVLSE